VTLSAPSGVNRLYQWRKGGADIARATNSSYTTSIGGRYKVLLLIQLRMFQDNSKQHCGYGEFKS
jgi:hypothetical protein